MEFANTGCDRAGTKSCSARLKESCCSAKCQKDDWKTQKISNRLVKRMPDVLIPFDDVYSTAKDALNQTEAQIANLGTQKYIRLLQHALTFAQNQFGERIAGTSLYSKGKEDRIDVWDVEMNLLSKIYDKFGYYDSSNVMYYYQKSLTILGPWIVQIGLSEIGRTDVLTELKVYYLFGLLSNTEFNLGVLHSQPNDWDKARHYIEQSILHGKQMKEGEDKVEKVYRNISSLSDLHYKVDNLAEAKAVREETYIYVSSPSARSWRSIY